MQDTYGRWQEGEMSSEEALKELCQSFERVQDRLQPLQETEKILRAQISEVVERLGGRYELEGFGRLQNTGAGVTVTYDRKRLDELVERLKYEGHPELAREIESYRKESARSGSLRITRPQE